MTSLPRKRREIEQEIVGGLGAAALGRSGGVLAAVERTALEAERDDLKPASRRAATSARARLYVEHARAEDAVAAVGGDDAVARLAEQRRTLLLATEDKALRYLRLRIGIAAAEQALRAYRDKHRSSMMSRASDAFRTISRGAYSGLAAQPGDKGDVLVALGAGGVQGSVAAVEGHALPALSGAARRGLLRILPVTRAGALRGRRHHGDLRRFPRRGGVPPLRPDGRGGPGDLSHPSPPSRATSPGASARTCG